jgi:hypothetical protein
MIKIRATNLSISKPSQHCKLRPLPTSGFRFSRRRRYCSLICHNPPSCRPFPRPYHPVPCTPSRRSQCSPPLLSKNPLQSPRQRSHPPRSLISQVHCLLARPVRIPSQLPIPVLLQLCCYIITILDEFRARNNAFRTPCRQHSHTLRFFLRLEKRSKTCWPLW